MFPSLLSHIPATVCRSLAGLIVVLALVACGDDDSGRQFAGDEQATGPAEETAVQGIPTLPSASLAPVPSPISEEQMFVGHGSQPATALIIDDDVLRFDAATQDITSLEVDEKYDPWLVDISPDGRKTAVLVSPDGSLVQWKVVVFDESGRQIELISVVGGQASPVASSEVVATGTGGMDWSPDGSTIAVALPTGGIYAVKADGRVEQMSPPRRAARPGAIAWSPNGPAIAFANQPDPKSGLGLNVATTTALPLDPVQLLRPDPTGNRSVRYLEWMPDGSSVIAIVDRKETGGARGDVFALEVGGGQPELIWSSGLHTRAGADAISVSPDGSILAVLTTNSDGESAVILRQIGGPSEVERSFEATISGGEFLWTEDGLIVVGEPSATPDGEAPAPVVLRIDNTGDVEQIAPAASPAASPEPAASPAGSPVSSPVPVPLASPVASPGASPDATPQASPATAEAVD